MNTFPESTQTVHVSPVSDLPVLSRMRRALRSKLTRIWPTRYQSLCPPACAALVDAQALQAPQILYRSGKCLVLFLSDDYAAHLETLANTAPCVRIHPDIGLAVQSAYLSWSVPATYPALPVTVWLRVAEVIEALNERAVVSGNPVLPLVLVAGEVFALGSIKVDDSLRRQCVTAMTACEAAPSGYSEPERAKAKDKALKYGEQPWLLMRYELKNGGRRLAVNLAPVLRMCPGSKEQKGGSILG